MTTGNTETYHQKKVTKGNIQISSMQFTATILTDKDKEWKTLEPVLAWDYTKL
jgi:hypothetical protein